MSVVTAYLAIAGIVAICAAAILTRFLIDLMDDDE